nr:Tim44/TimA family putative adaptor protein [Pseudaquidulcibacter saccharophilus]
MLDSKKGKKVEIIFFAVVALLVIARLYQVLGQNRGAPPPFVNNGQNKPDAFGNNDTSEQKEIAPHPSLMPPLGEDKPYVAPTFSQYGDLAPKILEIVRYDNSFDPQNFTTQAYSAYETIITAFSTGDENTLQPLLSDNVFTAYKAAIEARRATGGGKIDIIRLLTPTIKDISINGKIATIDVLFQSTLTESNAKPRAVNEIWSFERNLGSKNPIWKLIAVEPA